MKSGELRVGIVGCGGFVRGNHLPNAAANPLLSIRALCDLDSATLDSLRPRYQPDYVTTDFSRLAADPEIDLVIIGAGPKVRVPLIRAAAEHGKHVYVEKPMSLGYEDSREIVDIVEAAGIKLQVGFNRPYSRIMREARRIFHTMADGPALISYRIVGESALWPEFHRNQLANGETTIIHEATHIFDLLNWLVGDAPRSVYCVGEGSDNNIITMSYDNDVVAAIISGGCGTAAYPKERMEVFSGHSVLVMNEFVELECAGTGGTDDRRFPLKAVYKGRADLPVTDLRRELAAWRAQLTQAEIETGYYYNSMPCVDKGHYDALEAFRACIVDGSPVEADHHRGALSTIIGLKTVESLETGRPVFLEDVEWRPGKRAAVPELCGRG